jgi:hypothetical protein
MRDDARVYFDGVDVIERGDICRRKRGHSTSPLVMRSNEPRDPDAAAVVMAIDSLQKAKHRDGAISSNGRQN